MFHNQDLVYSHNLGMVSQLNAKDNCGRFFKAINTGTPLVNILKNRRDPANTVVSCGGTTRGECLCYIECIIIMNHAQRCVHVIFCRCFFMAALVGQTAERIFTKLSHVVDN